MEYFDVCILQWRRLKDQLVTDKGRDNEGRGGGREGRLYREEGGVVGGRVGRV